MQVAIEQLQQELSASRKEEQAIREEASRVSYTLDGQIAKHLYTA